MLFSFVLLVVFINSYAVDLGRVGHAFPIIEVSVLDIINKRLAAITQEDLEKMQQESIKKVKESINRPKGIYLPRATITRIYEYNPGIVVTRDRFFDVRELDIFDRKNKVKIWKMLGGGNSKIVFLKKGMTLNPLDYYSVPQPLLFINGDDKEQVKWAVQQRGIINLVQGEPLKLARRLNREVRFDQLAVNIKKLGIKNLPARVYQPKVMQKKVLLVEEVFL